MKLLMLASAYPPDTKGGGEVSTQLLAEALLRRGHDIQILTISDNASNDIVNDVPVERIKSPNIYWNYKKKVSSWKNLVWHLFDNWNPLAKRIVRAKIKSFKPDLLVTSTSENFGTSAWMAAKQAGIPAVHILRSHNIMCINSMMFRNGHNCPKPCDRCNILCAGKKMASRKIDGAIGVSNYVLSKHVEHGYFSNDLETQKPDLISIPDIVTLDNANNVQTSKQLGSIVTFGYIGRIMEEKGLDPLIAAWKSLAKDVPTKLIIAGIGDATYVNGLKNQLEGYDVEFTGWIKPEDFFPRIDFLVIPSILQEVLGRVVIEGFSYAVPALGSTQGGIRDMIMEGENGFLFDPFNPAELEMLMRKVSQDPDLYKTLSRNAFQSCANYSEDILTKRYEDYFLKIISSAD